MTQAVRRAVHCCLTPAYLRMEIKVGGLLGLGFQSTSEPLLQGKWNPSGIQGVGAVAVVPHRTIKKYTREYKLALRARRFKEQFKFPERYSKLRPRSAYSDWNYKAELFAFGSRLNEQFNERLLREALTDQSYIHQERKKQEELGIDTAALEIRSNMELAEFGAKLTENVLKEFLLKEFPLLPQPGQRALRDHLSSVETMSEVASNLGMRDLILCEEYPPSDETFSKAMFAVIGAVHQSSDQGQAHAEKFVIDFIASLLCGKDVNEIWDIPRPWAMMEVLAKEKNLYPIEPRIIRETGRNTLHAVFVVGVYTKDKKLLGTGIGETLDIAQEMSARDVLKGFFNTRDPRPPFEFQSANIPYKLIPQVRNISQA